MSKHKSNGKDNSSAGNSEKKNRTKRKLNPNSILAPDGYRVGVFASGLTTPINLIITENGDMLLGESGVVTGSGRVLKYNGKSFDVVAEGFNPPLTGINYYNGNIYVSHRGFITIVKPDGSRQDIIAGLPSWGDHHNNQVVFGPDGKMYFGQGTATNSGVIGSDNAGWVKKYPFFHDYPGDIISLNGQNFYSRNFLTAVEGDFAYTGAYSPFGIPNQPGETVKGIVRANGSILRSNPDGTNLQLVAWGLRNPFRLKFDKDNRLFAGNHGMDVRGSRPIANSPDEFQQIIPGTWYGWPDYTGGYPVTLPIFKAENEAQPSFLLSNHPMVPQKPFAIFTPHSAIMGFDFNYNNNFGEVDYAYIAEFGSMAPGTTGGKPLHGVGHRVSKISMHTGQITPFIVNKYANTEENINKGGLERPIDVVLDKNGTMYIVDFGLTSSDGHSDFVPGTGVIWTVKSI